MTESKTESETPLKLGKQTRKFRGKDIIVFFSEYKDECHFGFNVDVQLTVDDFIFVAASSFKPNKETAYEQAIERLEKNYHSLQKVYE